MNLYKTRGEFRYSGRVNISCSACDTSHGVPHVVYMYIQN